MEAGTGVLPHDSPRMAGRDPHEAHLAVGVPRMFASIERTGHLDNSVMVLGYVIMRVALVFQWLRAATDNRARRRVCLTYAATISIAQVGWVVQIVAPLATSSAIILGSILVLIEVAGPVLAERQAGGTPWHAHHIAERHSLFATLPVPARDRPGSARSSRTPPRSASTSLRVLALDAGLSIDEARECPCDRRKGGRPMARPRHRFVPSPWYPDMPFSRAIWISRGTSRGLLESP
jgi:hypothetical protein